MNKFAAMGWIKHSEEDDFVTGCEGKAIMDGGHETFNAATLDELIKQCAHFVGQTDLKNCLLDSCEEAGRLDIQVYEDAEGMPASEDAINKWKDGKYKIWLATYTFNLLKVERVVISYNVADKKLYAEG